MSDKASQESSNQLSVIGRFLSEQQDPNVTQRVYDRVLQILTRDEEIIYIAVQKPLVSMSPDSVVLTNRRFIIYKPKLLGRVDFEDYIWRNLSDMKLKEGMIHASLSMQTTQGKTIVVENLPKAQARKLYSFGQEMEEKALEERRLREMEEKRAAAGGINIQGLPNHSAPPTSVQQAIPPQEDPLQILTKLKAMLDAELITQEEYDAKKIDILSRM